MEKEEKLEALDNLKKREEKINEELTEEDEEISSEELSKRLTEIRVRKELNLDENEEELIKKLEAIMFLSAKFLSLEDLVRTTGINPITLKEMLIRLHERYQKQKSALIIIHRKTEVGDFFKMDVKKEYHSMINKIATGDSEFTKAEQETLAVIAYKQPIKQSTIVKIRGNKSYEHIRHFIQVGLVKTKKVSRTIEIGLSDKFYDYFSINKKEI